LIDENAKNHLKEIAENKPRITANEIQKDFTESDLQISTKTIRTHLHDLGLYSRFAARKPLLTVSQLQNLLNWCIERRDWSIKEWNEIIWSDESRFCLFSDGPQRVWRENGKRFNLENLVPTVKHGGGGVMVWGCFCGTGLGPLVLVEGKLNRFGYIQILENNLPPCHGPTRNSIIAVIFSNKIMRPSILPKTQRTGCLRNRLRFSQRGPHNHLI